jgi:hypothetical protein
LRRPDGCARPIAIDDRAGWDRDPFTRRARRVGGARLDTNAHQHFRSQERLGLCIRGVLFDDDFAPNRVLLDVRDRIDPCHSSTVHLVSRALDPNLGGLPNRKSRGILEWDVTPNLQSRWLIQDKRRFAIGPDCRTNVDSSRKYDCVFRGANFAAFDGEGSNITKGSCSIASVDSCA